MLLSCLSFSLEGDENTYQITFVHVCEAHVFVVEMEQSVKDRKKY